MPGTTPVRLPGEPASPLALPSGCSFHLRCAERRERCSSKEPIFYSIDGSGMRAARCLFTATSTEQSFAV